MNSETTTKIGQAGTGGFGNQVAPIAAAPTTSGVPNAASGGNFTAHLPFVPVSPTKLLLTVRDCANLTALSEKTILRLIQRGKIRCLSSVRHKRIAAAELARFIREN